MGIIMIVYIQDKMSFLTTEKQGMVSTSAELVLFRLSTKFYVVPNKKVS